MVKYELLLIHDFFPFTFPWRGFYSQPCLIARGPKKMVVSSVSNFWNHTFRGARFTWERQQGTEFDPMMQMRMQKYKCQWTNIFFRNQSETFMLSSEHFDFGWPIPTWTYAKNDFPPYVNLQATGMSTQIAKWYRHSNLQHCLGNLQTW